MYRIIIFALCVIICSGCSDLTPSELRSDPGLHSRFIVNDSIQIVIKNIMYKKDECRWDTLDSVTLLEELGEARIEHRSYAGASAIFFLTDLRRQSDKTYVDIYATYKMHERGLKIIEYGAKGLPGCPQ